MGGIVLEFLLKDQSPHPDAPPYDDAAISIPGPSGLPMTLYIRLLQYDYEEKNRPSAVVQTKYKGFADE